MNILTVCLTSVFSLTGPGGVRRDAPVRRAPERVFLHGAHQCIREECAVSQEFGATGGHEEGARHAERGHI